MKKSLAIVLLVAVFLISQSVLVYAHDEKGNKTDKKSQVMDKCADESKQHCDGMTEKVEKKMEGKGGCCAMKSKVSEKKEAKKKD